MPDLRCDWSDLLTAECAHCRKLDLDTSPATGVARWFLASYSGRCAHCGKAFEVGDRIGRTFDDQYVCSTCDLA